MGRFLVATGLYIAVCLAIVVAIILHGDGPHPNVIDLYPHSGDRYFPGGLVEITFSQAMNEYSVERALEVSPGSEGQGAWFGNTLNIQPMADWKPDTTYHIRLVGKVTDSEGRPLRTPVSFWFRVYRVEKTAFCSVNGTRSVCDTTGSAPRPLLHPLHPVLSYALSPDGAFLAYTRRDGSGTPHLFILSLDSGRSLQVTHGTAYADSRPHWLPGYAGAVTYRRRPVIRTGGKAWAGRPQEWEVQTDGSSNSRLS
jgi:hypothetical protein